VDKQSSRLSDYDFNEQELEGKAKQKTEYYKPNIKPKKAVSKPLQ